MKILIDTNILIDAILDRKPFNIDAKNILSSLQKSENSMYITSKELMDIHYIIKRELKNEKQTRNIISKLFEIYNVIDTSGYACSRALASSASDYEDAVMLETAKEYKMDLVLTRDKDYKNNKYINVYTPKELLSILNS